MKNLLSGRMKRAALVALGLAGLAMGAGRMQAQEGKLALAAPVTYDNKYELFVGLNYMGFEAGPGLAKVMNLAGVEVSGTYWVTKKWGATLDFRPEAGTSFVTPNVAFNGRAIVALYSGLGGVQYRVGQNQKAAFSLHAYGGAAHGDFSETITVQQGSGFYNNETKPIEAAGGAFDFNLSKNFALRLAPDVVFEQFGPGSRQYFYISGGLVWRIGKK